MHPYGLTLMGLWIVSNDAFVVRPTAIRNTMRMYVTRFPMVRNGEPGLIIAGVRMPVTDRYVALVCTGIMFVSIRDSYAFLAY